jgi:hypothetical protein
LRHKHNLVCVSGDLVEAGVMSLQVALDPILGVRMAYECRRTLPMRMTVMLVVRAQNWGHAGAG